MAILQPYMYILCINMYSKEIFIDAMLPFVRKREDKYEQPKVDIDGIVFSRGYKFDDEFDTLIADNKTYYTYFLEALVYNISELYKKNILHITLETTEEFLELIKQNEEEFLESKTKEIDFNELFRVAKVLTDVTFFKEGIRYFDRKYKAKEKDSNGKLLFDSDAPEYVRREVPELVSAYAIYLSELQHSQKSKLKICTEIEEEKNSKYLVNIRQEFSRYDNFFKEFEDYVNEYLSKEEKSVITQFEIPNHLKFAYLFFCSSWITKEYSDYKDLYFDALDLLITYDLIDSDFLDYLKPIKL